MSKKSGDLSNLSIVRYEPSDLDEMMKIEDVSFSAPWTRKSYEDVIALDTVEVWVAKVDGEVVGYMLLQYVAEEMELHTFAVKPGHRQMGIGRRLLGYMLLRAEERCVGNIFLLVRPSNEVAKSLYEKFGFKNVGIRFGYYQDNGEDAILMRLSMSR